MREVRPSGRFDGEGRRVGGIATSGSLKESGINRQLRSSRREEM